jgi:SepF-like predicted cell division protein (DUF552 family)
MKKFLESIKKRFNDSNDEMLEGEQEYVEIDNAPRQNANAKVIVRPFVLQDFADTKSILDALRAQDTIALINIAPLRDKDIVELKRSINKLKKTVDAVNGDIAGFGDDHIVIAPAFAQIWRKPAAKSDEE